MSQIKIGNQMFTYSSMFPLQMNSEDSIYKYKGNSGICYKYDLSKLSDRQRYENDSLAQINDSTKTDTRISLDRGMNQYGGGIK